MTVSFPGKWWVFKRRVSDNPLLIIGVPIVLPFMALGWLLKEVIGAAAEAINDAYNA